MLVKMITSRLADTKKVSEPAPLSLMRIAQMRSEIDAIDEELTRLLLRRLDIASVLGNLKQELGMPVKDRNREDSVLRKVKNRIASSEHANNVVQLYKAILNESCKIQNQEKNSHKPE